MKKVTTKPKPSGDKQLKIPGVPHLPKKPMIKGVDNNIVYGGAALLLLGGGFYAYQNGWLAGLPFIGSFFTQAPSAVTSVTVTGTTGSSSIPQGTGATAAGVFNPKATTTFYNVTNATGQSVLNGTLGTNVTTFSTPLATNNLPVGPYTLTISDSPIPITGQSSTQGQVLGTNQQLADNFVPTSFTKNMSAAPGEGASGPTNITLG